MRTIGFDSKRFFADLARAAQKADLTMNQVAHTTGVEVASLSRIGSAGVVPDGINLAALCKWARLNAADYSVDLAGK